jgi:glycerophosphoryl diester phosphodiesterase
LPEHTLAAYALAILQGADFVEPDLVLTRDGQLVCRHDNALNLTTDVACRREFADRQATKNVDGKSVTGWFSEDFTVDEIKKLRAVERIPAIRPANARFDGQFEVPTLQEAIDLVQGLERATGRSIGIYPEIKHPAYFAGCGLPAEPALVDTLRRSGYEDRPERVFVQCLEVASLKRLRRVTGLPLVQLLAPEGAPHDILAAGSDLTYARMATPAGLADIAAYADAVGPEKYRFIIPLRPTGHLDPADRTRFVADAHDVGLKVHAYTFRAENHFLPLNYRSSLGGLGQLGNAEGELQAFLAAGIDGFFTDQADIGVGTRDQLAATR